MCVTACAVSCSVRDAIPPCDPQEFVKEAEDLPHFLEEVEACKNFRSTDATVLSGELTMMMMMMMMMSSVIEIIVVTVVTGMGLCFRAGGEAP